MPPADDEEGLLRTVALQNARSILLARQRVEQELARSLAMMRATLESTTDAILVIDANRQIATFNRQYLALWGIPAELLESLDYAKLLRFVSEQLKQPQAFLARVEEIYAAAIPESFDLLELSDGRVFERYSRSQVDDGRTVGRVWSFRDVTDRKRAEEALQDEARILSLLNKTGSTLASQLELATLVQSVTDAATELSGARFGAFFYTTTNESGDTSTLYAVSGATSEAFRALGVPRATALLGPTFSGEATIRCDDVLEDPRYGRLAPHHGLPQGHPAIRSYLAVPVLSRSSEVIGTLLFGHPRPGVFTERTERLMTGVAAHAGVAMDNARLFETAQRAAEERTALLASERAARAEAERTSSIKDEFLATLSHELRTPLSAILGWSHVLQHRVSDAPDLRQGLEAIERNARVQTQLIEDLLDMSRITSGRVRLDVQPVAPASFLHAAIQTVRPAADAKGIRLDIVLDPDAGPIAGDPSRLQQVIWNLLSNAIKFTPRGGKVQVLLERVSSHIEISIADTGIGIRPEFIPHVFERFRQADASSTRQFGGLGLGLSIVKHLVELHGGTVTARSEGEDRGTTFTVALPLAVVQGFAQSQGRRHPAAPGAAPLPYGNFDLSGIRVLVVDDQADARDLVQRVLTDCGAEVLTADSASQALAMVEESRPHVLVSDIGMPDVDGFELLRRIRALGPSRGGRIPAVALTALARSEDRTRALRAGFIVHVSKPVEPAELVATVASAAGRIEGAESR